MWFEKITRFLMTSLDQYFEWNINKEYLNRIKPKSTETSFLLLLKISITLNNNTQNQILYLKFLIFSISPYRAYSKLLSFELLPQ